MALRRAANGAGVDHVARPLLLRLPLHALHLAELVPLHRPDPPLLRPPARAYFVAGHLGAPRAAVFILHASTAFAAGYAGYSLARC